MWALNKRRYELITKYDLKMQDPILPKRLKNGAHIRVVAPSFNANVFSRTIVDAAHAFLSEKGYGVSFSKYLFGENGESVSSIEGRVSDLHAAFLDPTVDGILTITGGFCANQILEYLDYELIARHAKLLCGYSDVTALSAAILRKSNLITYSGPHFSVFGVDFKELRDKLLNDLNACVGQDSAFELCPPSIYIDHPWKDAARRRYEDPFVMQPGKASGRIIGGNLCTLNLLQGTPYMPSLEDSILFLEDDSHSDSYTFDRNLQALLHLPEARGVRGVAFGKFQAGSAISDRTLVEIVRSKRELSRVPIAANFNFGHTYPMATFPIGGTVELSADGPRPSLRIISH